MLNLRTGIDGLDHVHDGQRGDGHRGGASISIPVRSYVRVVAAISTPSSTTSTSTSMSVSITGWHSGINSGSAWRPGSRDPGNGDDVALGRLPGSRLPPRGQGHRPVATASRTWVLCH